MTATDELRAMLDERGVRWDYGPSGASSTAFWVNGKELSFSNWRDGLVCSTILTPAQVIAATLGTGDCEIETTESWLPAMRYHRCKHCGAFFAVLDASKDIPPCACPNCGRKVVEK